MAPILAAFAFAAASAVTPSFHVEKTGSGPAMILIPGLSSDGAVWDGTVARFRDRYTCHVLTLAGFAGRPAIDAPFLETVRNDLATYLRENHLDKPVVVGHSLGGFLALWLAETEPDLVGPLVIVDALPFVAGAQGPQVTADAARKMAEGMRAMMDAQSQDQYEAFVREGTMLRSMVTRPEDLERVKAWGLASDRRAVALAMYELYVADLRDGLPKIASPTLVLGSWIGMKSFTTRDEVEGVFARQFAGLPGHEFALSDGAKHFIMLDDPEWFQAKLDAFLASPSR